MKILVVDDDRNFLEGLMRTLRKSGYELALAPGADVALKQIKGFDLLVTDLQMPGMDGLGLLREAKRIKPGLEVILMTGHGSAASAVQAMKEGARAYLTKPFPVDELLAHFREAERTFQLRAASGRFGRGALTGSSAVMQRVYSEVDLAGMTDAPVMVSGETGTGKDLAAQAVHAARGLAASPFVAVNAGAIPRDMVEGELFGYEKGAFTGAAARKKGRFQLAHSGSLFLDEVDALSLDLQSKLLRALEQKEIWPLGSEKPDHVDVRIISATNANIEKLVETGRFREDLYYRLNVVRIRMPALRERAEDIPQLAQDLLKRLPGAKSNPEITISPEALAYLLVQPWKGNVRELFNVLQRAHARALAARQGGADLTRLELDLHCFDAAGIDVQENLPFREAKVRAMDVWTVATLRSALLAAGGSVSGTARRLKMSRTALSRLITRYNLREYTEPGANE